LNILDIWAPNGGKRIPLVDTSQCLINGMSKAKAARIRYAQKGTYRAQPYAKNIDNPVLDTVQGIDAGRGHPVEEILYGFAQAADHQQPLNTSCLLVILQCMPVINTREVQLMLAVGDRQARKYVQAVKAALPYIEKELHHSKAA